MSEEARTGKRFPLELPIKIHGADQGGEHNATTANLSAAGVYIRAADATLEVGSTVEFEIALPPEVTGANKNVIVHCQGRVVRTDEPGGKKSNEPRGVACVIDSYEMVRQP
ncbi:MAG: PilZ domain-containing protein [Acidobacteriales bacterium]|nr:PilZ domain-containing protein [Terriglobales bacterium]